MECDRNREEIAAFVDGELGPAAHAELESHLETCAGCRELVAAERRLGEMFAALPPVTPTGDFEARFWARVAREHDSAALGTVARIAAFFTLGRALALGALAAVALAFALDLSRGPFPATSPPAAGSAQTTAAATAAKTAPDPDVRIVTNAKDFELLQDPDMDAISNVDVLEDWDDASPS
jgi:anti-sigma factor RsiW